MTENSSKKPQVSINERLKFLIEALNLSARAFSAVLEVPDSNTRNYLSKGTKLNSDYLESISSHFSHVNLGWLITGEGEMFTGETPPVTSNSTTRIKKVSGGAVHNVTGNQTNNYTISDCERERDSYKVQLDRALREIELLTGQLQTKDALIASKEETIDLLKAAFNRPN